MDFSTPQLGEVIEQGKQTAVNVVKTAVSDTAATVSSQIGLNDVNTKAQIQANPQDQATQQGESAQIETARTKEMVRDFYSPSEDVAYNASQTEAVTEEQRLASVRQRLNQELHNETYYEPLFAYEHNLNKTESKTEELEREKQQEMQELEQKQAEKPQPLSVQRAQTHIEVNPGIAG